MITRKMAVPTTPTPLSTILDRATSRVGALALQAPSANAAIIYFGGESEQYAELPSGSSSDIMPVKSTDDIYLYGTTGDYIIVIIF